MELSGRRGFPRYRRFRPGSPPCRAAAASRVRPGPAQRLAADARRRRRDPRRRRRLGRRVPALPGLLCGWSAQGQRAVERVAGSLLRRGRAVRAAVLRDGERPLSPLPAGARRAAHRRRVRALDPSWSGSRASTIHDDPALSEAARGSLSRRSRYSTPCWRRRRHH